MASKTTLKYCRGCEKKKGRSAFGNDKSKKDGLHYLCLACMKVRYQANPDRSRAYRKLHAARMRAKEFPDSDADQLRYQELQVDFERQYGELERRGSPASEVEKHRQQKYEEMFMKILLESQKRTGE